MENSNVQNQGVFVKHYMYALAATKSKKLFFSFKVKVKVTRSFTLISFERVSLVEYACQIWSLLSLTVQKLIAKVKVDNRQTDRQIGQKQYAPDHLIWGIKM